MRQPFHVMALALVGLAACGEPSPRARPQRVEGPPVRTAAERAHASDEASAPTEPGPGPDEAWPDEAWPDEAWPEPRIEPASWAFIPTIDSTLREAFREDERAEVLLDALVRTLAPYRWAGVDEWDNLGFIRIEDDAPRGFVTQVDEMLRMQPEGVRSLGCAGGFLEGLRAVLTPSLRMSDLQQCDASTLEPLEPLAPSACRPEDFGLHAIANAVRIADAAGALSKPASRLHLEPSDPAALAPLLAPGVLQLCTVSHEPTVGPRIRLYHHLMLVLRAQGPRALMLFDTTGYRGVALRRIDTRGLSRYVTTALARNDTYHYDPASTHVDCLTITRRS